MQLNTIQFSIAAQAAWAPDLETPEAWQAWEHAPYVLAGDAEPRLPDMPAMLRRRAGGLGKMALEVAYRCLNSLPVEQRENIPTVFCSRHGDVQRATELLNNLTRQEPLSPTSFGLAVHNATAGLLSIARHDQASHAAVAAGNSSVEHAVIEACSQLADGAPMVLLVVCDTTLPQVFSAFQDSLEQPHAWAWLMVPAAQNVLQLSWQASALAAVAHEMPASLQVLKFFLSDDADYQRHDGRLKWHWDRHVG